MDSSSLPYRNSEQGGRNPPRYSSLSLAPLPVYPSAGDLDISVVGDPLRNEGTSLQSFEFCLESGGRSSSDRHAWATLRLLSSVPGSLQRPRYTGGEPIRGSVLLDLKKPQAIQSISVVLRGSMITSSLAEGSHLFLELVSPVWDDTQDIPLSTATSQGTSGKLYGQYEWPFSIVFPPEFQVPLTPGKNKQRSGSDEEAQPQAYKSPQTVLERGINANVVYEIVLKITSGLFHTKHRATANILHVPTLRSPPLPPLRAGAYLNKLPLVGPNDDPSGWEALSPLLVRLSKNGVGYPAIEVKCTVYIANPCIYTRGTVIPCYLILKAAPSTVLSDADTAALLQAFTSHHCISLALFQRVAFFQDPTRAQLASSSNMVKTAKNLKDDRTSFSVASGFAVWWAPERINGSEKPSSGAPSHSHLEGEIHLDLGLLPSTDTPFFVVSHHVSVSLDLPEELEIQVPSEAIDGPSSSRQRDASISGSTLEDKSTREITSLAVSIATAHGSGPVPYAYTPRPPPKKKDLSSIQDLQYYCLKGGRR